MNKPFTATEYMNKCIPRIYMNIMKQVHIKEVKNDNIA